MQLATQADDTRRAEYWAKVMGVCDSIDQLVFIDETGADKRSGARHYGFALRGKRARSRKTFVRGTRYNVCAAVDRDGLFAWHVLDHTVRTVDFNDFFERDVLQHLNAWPGPRSVVVLDNASFHDRAHLTNLCWSRGALCLFLSPYSPDFNPIELTFQSLKQYLRSFRADWERDQLGTLLSAIDSLRYDHSGAFASCGYSDSRFAAWRAISVNA